MERGSITQNFVDLTTAQNIGGVKTFNGAVTFSAETQVSTTPSNSNDVLRLADLVAGNSLRSTTGAPTAQTFDQSGDFAIDMTNEVIYGPFSGNGTSGTWPSGKSFASTSSFTQQPSLMPALLPTGAVAENFPRILTINNDTALTSGTPGIFAGPYISAGTAIHAVNLYQSGTAPSSQTHAWIAILNSSGVVQAVSADAGSTAWSSGTFGKATVNLSATWTPSSGIQTFVAILVVASTMPTFRGINGGGGNADALAPILAGNSTTTGQTTPPSTSSSLGMPSSGVSWLPYIYFS